MSSSAVVVCREIFDENSQPSAEEISEYAQQLGIDPESESHLLPLAKDGLMQALPAPWKAYFDEKLQTHYYYNEDTKKTQWEHPLDRFYKELVKKARDASMLDDTCASVQELLTSEENTKQLERIETKVESDEELSTDSDHVSDFKETSTNISKRLTPLGRPPMAPLSRLEKKLGDLKISPLRRSIDNTVLAKPSFVRNSSGDTLIRPIERPKMLFKQQSEIIDLKMHVLHSPEDENFRPLFSAKPEQGLPLTGKGSMFLKGSKSDLPSPDTDKSLPLDSLTKSDPPKGILREKLSNTLQRKCESITFGKPKTHSFEEDKKSVRFKLETLPDPTVSPGSNSSSELNDGPSSIISAAPPPPAPTATVVPLSSHPIVLSPLLSRPPLPPRPQSSLDTAKEKSVSESLNEHRESRGTSPRKRLLRPPATEYIKPDLFQKNFQKISDLVRPENDEEPDLDEPLPLENNSCRPRSPMIPQKNKISINLMESIESETSIDSPDAEFANLDLNDFDFSDSKKKDDIVDNPTIAKICDDQASLHSKSSSKLIPSRTTDNVPVLLKIPKLELLSQSKSIHSDSDDSKKTSTKDVIYKMSRTDSVESKERLKVSPSFGSELRSPRSDFIKPWSNLSPLKPLNKAVIAPLKPSESATNLKQQSPRLDGVILSQGKSSSDNVVVLYQFDSQEAAKPIKSPLIPDMTKDLIERNKADEKRRLDLALQKDLENMRKDWILKEKKMRADLQEELNQTEDKFSREMKMRLDEQIEIHKRELEEALSKLELNHKNALAKASKDSEDRYYRDVELLEKEQVEKIQLIKNDYQKQLAEQQKQLDIDKEHSLSELRNQLCSSLNNEKARMVEENRSTIESLREEHHSKINDLKQDYRAEVERLRGVHAAHLHELRASARAPPPPAPDLRDKYRALKQKYARLKHDVKMSIERRNKRREMSMTTGSETEKSNSHKANQSLERCKELNETSVSAVIESEPRRNVNTVNVKFNDNETSYSDSNALKFDNNNEEWKLKKENCDTSTPCMQPSQPMRRAHRRGTVAFREPPRRRPDRDRDATTDFQDSSDATTADEKPKETLNGHSRRRHFTRLKSASTSRLNYSPKRNEGWSSPLESLRQQLRKLDDLEDQFPDLACQPAFTLRYPFTELGDVYGADAAEIEFVRHRALVEREGVRRARAVLRGRRDELRAGLQRPQSQEREATELEVGLHRARALLAEKDIRLRHIERALSRLPRAPPQEVVTSSASSVSSAEGGGEGGEGGAVLQSLRALHADVRDIWRALDARRQHTGSPETSSCNAPLPRTRMTLSAPERSLQDNSDGGVAERARGLRAWLQTAP